MGCCASAPYDDLATVDERRAMALKAAEARNKQSEMRGIKSEAMASKVRVSKAAAARTSGDAHGDRKSEQMARDWAS